MRRSIGTVGFFTLAFGAAVGSAWVVVLGDWLSSAAPGGALLGFAFGGLAITLIGLCYAELAARMPQAGGEFRYALQVFGPETAFFVGWFVTLFAVSVAAFEGIALAWMIRMLWRSASATALYEVFGHVVTREALIAGICGALLIGAVNLRSSRWAIGFQNIVTIAFILVAGALVVGGLWLGSSRNLEPLLEPTSGGSWQAGAFWVFATCALFLNGFQAALHAIEERRATTPVRWAVSAMVAGIICAAVFYCLIILAAASAVPWRTLVTMELPAVQAFRALTGSWIIGQVVLIAAIMSLLKTWNAIVVMGSRLIHAQAQLGFLPAPLAGIAAKSGIPRAAVLVLTFASLGGVAAGRGAIVPIVNMCSIALALSFLVCLAALWRLRRLDDAKRVVHHFRAPGGQALLVAASASAAIMAGVAFIEPALRQRTVPVEWILIGAWGLLGTAFLLWKHRKDAATLRGDQSPSR